MSGCVGVLIDSAIYRPLRRRKSPNLVMLLTSFGVFIFLQNVLQLAFGADVRSLRTGPVKEGHPFLGTFITNSQITILLSSLVLAVLLIVFLKITRIGKAMRAVADDPMAAGIVGIHTDKVISIAFFVGSILAGAGAILISLETNIEPTMGMNAILKGIIAAVVGGIGSVPGALVGGLFIGLAENFGIGGIGISAGWKDAIAFSILVAFLLLRPTGIFGRESMTRRV